MRLPSSKETTTVFVYLSNYLTRKEIATIPETSKRGSCLRSHPFSAARECACTRSTRDTAICVSTTAASAATCAANRAAASSDTTIACASTGFSCCTLCHYCHNICGLSIFRLELNLLFCGPCIELALKVHFIMISNETNVID